MTHSYSKSNAKGEEKNSKGGFLHQWLKSSFINRIVVKHFSNTFTECCKNALRYSHLLQVKQLYIISIKTYYYWKHLQESKTFKQQFTKHSHLLFDQYRCEKVETSFSSLSNYLVIMIDRTNPREGRSSSDTKKVTTPKAELLLYVHTK